jgi:hypothetical protein
MSPIRASAALIRAHSPSSALRFRRSAEMRMESANALSSLRPSSTRLCRSRSNSANRGSFLARRKFICAKADVAADPTVC